MQIYDSYGRLITVGIQGPTGSTGPVGSGGGSDIIYDNISRYALNSTTNQECYCMSSSTVWTGISWTRSTTTLTINRDSHGHAAGDCVILRNMAEPYLVANILAVESGSFTVTVIDSGGVSGTDGAYNLGFKATCGTGTLVISAPSGLDGSGIQLFGLNFRALSTPAGVLVMTMPAGINNGIGGQTSIGNFNLPSVMIRQNADTFPIVSFTIATNDSSSGYNIYQIAGLGASQTRVFSFRF